MQVFVTVGSTSFDQLIKTVCSEEILYLLSSKGFQKIVLQIGKGEVIPPENSAHLDIEWFRLKDNISEDIGRSSLVIGHAGAGSILESLLAHKPMIAVLNESLMDNHQIELADQMTKEGYLLSCTCPNLMDTLKRYFECGALKTFVAEENKFPAFLDEVMGLS